MIDEAERDKSLAYLASTDNACAKAKSLMLGLEAKEKTILATEVLGLAGTIQEKDARARTSDSYLKWIADYENSVYEYEIMKNRRTRAMLIVECWRSENANRRQAGGNL